METVEGYQAEREKDGRGHEFFVMVIFRAGKKAERFRGRWFSGGNLVFLRVEWSKCNMQVHSLHVVL